MNGYRCSVCASGRVVSKLIWSERGNKFWILELRNEDHLSECKKAVRNRFCVKHNFSLEFLREYYYSTMKMYIGGSKVRGASVCVLRMMEMTLKKCCCCSELNILSTGCLELDSIFFVGPFQLGTFYDAVAEIASIRKLWVLNKRKNDLKARWLNNSCKRW